MKNMVNRIQKTNEDSSYGAVNKFPNTNDGMVNKFQNMNEGLSCSAEGIRVNGSPSSPYNRLQVLSRTASTPPIVSHSEPLNMTRLKSASKVSTNPFVVADGKNNNFGKENLNANSTVWENFP